MFKLVALAASAAVLLCSCAGPSEDAGFALDFAPSTTAAEAKAGSVRVERAASALTVAESFPIGVCAYVPSDFYRISRVGIRHVRVDHPNAAMIEYARMFRVEVLPVAMGSTPDLSGSNDAKAPPLPHNYAEWSRRMIDRLRGTVKPPARIEVWNEPWHRGFWGGEPNPVAYLQLVKAFAAQAWAVWPGVVLLVSADSGMSEYPTFRRDLLAADSTGFLNDPRILPTVHTYVETRPPTAVTGNACTYDLNRFDCAFQAFKAHGHPDPRVWITEFGWESNTGAPGYSHFGAVSEAEQANYTIQALELFRSSNMVAGAFAFMMKENDNWNYNLLRPDNSDKPVVASLRQYLASDSGR